MYSYFFVPFLHEGLQFASISSIVFVGQSLGHLLRHSDLIGRACSTGTTEGPPNFSLKLIYSLNRLFKEQVYILHIHFYNNSKNR